MKKFSFIILLVIIEVAIQAQQCVPTQWYFGENAHIKFMLNCAVSTELTGDLTDLQTYEGTTIVCDNSGNVVFYAAGPKLWDNNTLITNQLLGDGSATQNALAVPIPGDPNSNERKYLLFSLRAAEYTGSGPWFSVCYINVVANPGFPTTYTVTADNPIGVNNVRMSEKQAFTSDGNGGYWLIVHDYSTSATAVTFYKYHITLSGFGSVTSSASAREALIDVEITQPTIWDHSGPFENGQGQMKFNKDGDKLGLVIAGSKTVQVFPFNKITGDLLYPTVTRSVTHNGNEVPNEYLYGFEFAPTNDELFYTAESQKFQTGQRYITQWRLSGGILTQYEVAHENSSDDYLYGALQLGPDDRIYCTHLKTYDRISDIRSPDIIGSGCNYLQDEYTVGGGTAHYGLPSYSTIEINSPDPPVPCQCTGQTLIGAISNINREDGTAGVTITLNSGDLNAGGVSIEFVNFEIYPNGSDCKNYCDLATMNMGMFVNPVPTISTIQGQLTPVKAGVTSEFSHEIIWDLSSNPRPINGQEIYLNLKFPTMYRLDCCQTNYRAAFRVTYYEYPCHICQAILYTVGGPVK